MPFYFNLPFNPQAKAIRENIGYPDYLKNKTALAMMYKGVSMFLTKMLQLSNITQKQNLVLIS